MPQKKNRISANYAWEKLIDKYPILEEIQKNGCYHIKASQIKQFKEPRLMAKWDSSDSLPKIYLNYKSYLERKTMSKLHKTFESFLAA